MARSILDGEILRVRIIYALMAVAFFILSFALWRIQVNEGQEFEDDISRQSIRRVRIPGQRGRIYDRNGFCLADNSPSYCIAVYLEELRQSGPLSRTVDKVLSILEDVGAQIGRKPEITERDIRLHMRKRLPLPLIAWRGLNDEDMARWAECGADVEGIDLVVETTRVYPEGASAAHLLGYVGRSAPGNMTEDGAAYHYYMPELVGRSGLELHFDDILRGTAGGRLVRVDVSGYKHDDLGMRDPHAGEDVELCLDRRIQRLAENSIRGRRGAAVVIDPNNGDILALASAPGFDPNDFVPSISSAKWAVLRDDPGKPMLNRAVAGEYTPASTFKPMVALAALASGKIDVNTTFNCPGHFKLGNSTFKCWYHPGHGLLTVREALKHSCNVFFYKAALESGHEAIYHMAQALGLGSKTGVEVDYERAGLLPDGAWKRRVLKEGWRDGDTCNMSIGQGYISVTPIQMAVVVAALANKGHVFKPRLLKGTRDSNETVFSESEPLIINEMNWNPAHIHAVREGMHDVVMAPDGTGRRARVHGVDMAGKTGTAEYGRKGSGKHYGWMIAFAPFDKPRYAAVIVIEEAVSGGSTTAPLMHNLMQGIFYGADAGQEGRG